MVVYLPLLVIIQSLQAKSSTIQLQLFGGTTSKQLGAKNYFRDSSLA